MARDEAVFVGGRQPMVETSVLMWWEKVSIGRGWEELSVERLSAEAMGGGSGNGKRRP